MQDLNEKRELPPGVAVGLNDISKRDGWNMLACPDYALTNETWREHIARRQHYEEVRTKLCSGEVTSINDFITYNLDIEKFVQDVIYNSESPEVIWSFWKAITNISILDPTCGSGAFLFAALNVLEPIYVASLESMRRFLNDLEYTKRKFHPETMDEFRQIVNRVSEHASESYFILKSIIVNNLYGVDIMEEAVEICKLRLFLKLVSQLESYEQIEPLPDIDFSIRTGNTLVGFTSLEGVKNALRDLVRKLSLPDIEKRADIADRAFREFREMQTNHDTDARVLVLAKAKLRGQLDGLRSELDSYLAGEYGIKNDEEKKFRCWRDSHQPFHWFVEFYGIMHDGGFNVIIGNPPYLETQDVPYSAKFFTNTGPIHSMCIERSLALCEQEGCLSMIVPLSLVSTRRMAVLQTMLEQDRDCWYSNFSERPGKLFGDVNRPLTIFQAIKPKNVGATYSTSYLKWYSDSRSYLISNLRYVECSRNRNSFAVPKLGCNLEITMLNKLMSVNNIMGNFLGKSRHSIYYRSSGGRYWKVFTDFAPKFYKNGVSEHSSTQKQISLVCAQHVRATVAILSSDIFWWWYTITSDLWHLELFTLNEFPVPESVMNDVQINELGKKYIDDLKRNSKMKERNLRTGLVESQIFQARMSKKIINEIDMVLATHYGFDEEEVDFLINYDIRFRMTIDE